MNQVEQRKARLYQAKHRKTGCSLKTQLENAQIILAWEMGGLSEGQASKALGIDRLQARQMRDEFLAAGMELAAELLAEKLRA